MRREVCIIYPRVQIGTSTRWGEFGGGGLTFFISELETTPSLAPRTPAYCIERCSPGMRLLYVAQAAHNCMIKGRTSSPTHAYVPSTARISNLCSGVRVSAAVVLRVIFRAVCRVFSVLCGSLLREWICLLVGRRKRVPAAWQVLSLCALRAVGYSARLLTLSLTSAVNSSKACIMSLSRIAIISLFSRPRKASRSAVESVWD